MDSEQIIAKFNERIDTNLCLKRESERCEENRTAMIATLAALKVSLRNEQTHLDVVSKDNTVAEMTNTAESRAAILRSNVKSK